MSIKEQLAATTKIALEALERLEEIGEVYKPDAEFPQWRWESNGEPLCDIGELPPGLLP